MSAVSPIAAAILPHIAIGCALAAGLWLVWLGVGFWGRLWEKTGYWLSDGRTVDRFRALAPEIEAYKAKMICHYEARRSAAPRHLEDASEDSLLIMKMATLFGDLQYLGIPRPDRQRFTDQNRRGLEFCVAYLTALEYLAEGGHLARARAGEFIESLWEAATVEESSVGGNRAACPGVPGCGEK